MPLLAIARASLLWLETVRSTDYAGRVSIDAKSGAFTQCYGSTALDASALLILLVGFLPASDPRVQSTVKAIGARLRDGPLVRRYDTDKTKDGHKGPEGVFLACSFWYADNHRDRLHFRRLEGCRFNP